MSGYATPFRERMRAAERYRTDSEFRLRKVNQSRQRRGLPSARHVDEILTADQVAEINRERMIERWRAWPGRIAWERKLEAGNG